MPRAEPKRQIKVFIASPSDLAVERRAFRDAIDLLNLGFGDGAGVEFIPLGWEDTLAVVRSRSQAAINQDIDACDIFVLVMHRRWGQPAPDAAPYSSYTEEEFYRALNRWRGAPLTPPTPTMKGSQPGYAGSGEIAGSVRPAASDSTATPTPSGGTGSGAMPLPPAPSPSLSSTPLRGLPGNTDVPVAEPSSGATALASSPSSPTSPSSGDTSTSQPRRAPDIFVFFKHIDPASMADPGPQLTQVLKFRRQLEDQRIVLYRNFADEKEFAKELDRHLRAYVHGDLPKADAPLEKLPLPLDLLRQVEEERAAAQRRVEDADAALKKVRDEAGAAEQRARASDARADQLALSLAERAAIAAFDGRLEEARQDFARATAETASLGVLSLAFEFYERVGDLNAATTVVQRWISLSSPDSVDAAAAYGNLGIICRIRGDTSQAEELHKTSLNIYEAAGSLAGMAAQFGNLGVVYGVQWKLDDAEQMLRKALTIYEELGQNESAAISYGNLGNLYMIRDQLDQAEEMYNRALEISKEHRNLDDIARHLGNLAPIHRRRGDSKRAEEMLKESIAIYEKLGRAEGLAVQYYNLGIIFAERSDMDEASRMFHNTLAMSEKIGRLDGIADACSSIGLLAKQAGNPEEARKLWTKACELYAKVGVQSKVRKIQGWLDELDQPPPSPAPAK